MTPDVTVMGAGIFGLSCAWELARRGARVRVIDPRGIGAGASGGVVGALSPHVPEQWNAKKAFQLRALLMADAFWAGAGAAGGADPGFARSGRLQPIADESALGLARARAVSAAALWEGKADWRVEPAPGGWGPVSPTGLVIRDTLSARIAPRAALSSLAAALRALGGEITADGAPRGAVLWATGVAGLRALGAGDAVKGQAARLAHAAPDLPQIFADGLHVVPHADGTVAVGSTSERVYSAETDTDSALDALVDRARAIVPALARAPVVERWAGLRPRARTRAPILGPWPGGPGHFVANGGFKIGFGIAPAVAAAMADLILDGRDTIPDGFRVEAALNAR